MPTRCEIILILILAGCVVLAGCGGGSSNPPTTAATSNLYVATQSNTVVTNLPINLDDGTLSGAGPKVATGSSPISMAITPGNTPAGTLAFVVNNQCVNGNTNCNSISSYTVNADGTLAALAGSTGTGTNPVAVTVNPASSLVFVANQGSDSISVFTIGTDGSLTSAPNSPFPTFADPVALAVSPNGKYLYVANSVLGKVSVYTIGSTGSLSLLPNAPFTGQSASIPSGVAVSADGKFIYVSNFGSNNISVFNACIAVSTICPIADGSLQEVPFSPFALGVGMGTGPGPILIDGTGTYLFVLDLSSNQISEFRINVTILDALTTTTNLVPAIPETTPTGVGATALAIHPTGRWLYTANYKASTITVYYLDTLTGVLTPSATPFATSGQPAALAVR